MMLNRNQLDSRLHRLETLLAAPRKFSDDETVQALSDGTATPAHLDHLYPIIAEDLLTNLYLFGQNFDPKSRYDPRASMFVSCPMATAIGALSYPAADDLPAELLDARTHYRHYDPGGWEKVAGGQTNQAAILRDLCFVKWAKTVLLNQALPSPDCIQARATIDGWCDGGPAPVDVDRTPSPRVVRLLAPLDMEWQLPLLMHRVQRERRRTLNIRDTPPIPRSPKFRR